MLGNPGWQGSDRGLAGFAHPFLLVGAGSLGYQAGRESVAAGHDPWLERCLASVVVRAVSGFLQETSVKLGSRYSGTST